MTTGSLDPGPIRKPSTTARRLQRFLAADVTEEWADLLLLVACFSTGLLDSAVFNIWGCFVGMQTGNTVYTGLGLSGQPASQPWRWAKSGTSILCFLLGTFFFSRLGRVMGPLRRGTMFYLLLVQAALCFAAAALVHTGIVPSDAGDRLPDDFIVLLPLGMLSAQSAGQIVVSRFLAYNELPTVVLTSTYCDLMFDPMVFTAPLRENAKRNRRAASVVLILLGAVVGGFLTVNGEIGVALWAVGGIKTALALIWLVWRTKGSIRLE